MIRVTLSYVYRIADQIDSQIWSTTSLTPLYVIHPFGETDAGDIYSLSFFHSPASPGLSSGSPSLPSAERSILFFGCQNTSLQWIDLSSSKLVCPPTCPKVSTPCVSSSKLQTTYIASVSTTESSSDYDDEDDEEEYHDHTTADADDEDPGDTQDSNSKGKLRPPLRPKPTKKFHKFFDSQPRGSQTHLPTLSSSSPSSIPRNLSTSSIGSTSETTPASSRRSKSKLLKPRTLRVPHTNMIESAHYGYIYCMAIVQEAKVNRTAFDSTKKDAEATVASETRNGEVRFVTGSGDEDVKLWSFTLSSPSSTSALTLLHTFTPPPSANASTCSSVACGGAVLSVMVRNGCIYGGFQGGVVVVWDLNTRSCVRSLVTKKVHHLSRGMFAMRTGTKVKFDEIDQNIF